MTTDSQKIHVLYESILYKNLDYLLLDNVDGFNWESFFDKYEFDKCHIFETFSNLGDTQLTKSGSFKRKYKIEINDLIFYVHISMHLLSDIQNSVSSGLIGVSKDDQSYKPIFDILNICKSYPDEYMCNVYFEDDNSNIKLTGIVGNYSLSVLRNVERCVKDLLNDSNISSKVRIMSFQVDKKEQKRMQLYRQFMHRSGFTTIFPNEILDNISSNLYSRLYFTK